MSKAVETPDEVLIETRCYSNAASDAIDRDFPHAFKRKITYRLSAEGLEQEVMFGNKRATFPCLSAWDSTRRSTFPSPAAMRRTTGSVLAVGECFELNGRNLPTGRLLPLDERFALGLRAPEWLQATGCEAIEAGLFGARDRGRRPAFPRCRGRESPYGSAGFLRGRLPDALLGRSGATAGRCPTAVPSRSRGPPMRRICPTANGGDSARSRRAASGRSVTGCM